jgi:hypothetical protein
MRQATVALGLFILLRSLPLFAQEEPQFTSPVAPYTQTEPANPVLESPSSTSTTEQPAEPVPWHPMWGILGLRAMPIGLRVGPNGNEYHPNFSLDLNLNGWLWRSQGLYLFLDARLWGEKSEYGVTNGNDSWFGTSKREIDLSGGAAWNYWGAWEARVFGYTNNNLNRGTSLVNPYGFTDGFGLENRYYLSSEYSRLGQAGFDVARATFLSIGYYPSKDMIGNNGVTFEPGMFLRAYLIYDLWDWRCYGYGDFQYISERSFQPRLLLFDVGLAVRPFGFCRQCEFRIGSENTADVKVHNDFSIGYLALRYIF